MNGGVVAARAVVVRATLSKALRVCWQLQRHARWCLGESTGLFTSATQRRGRFIMCAYMYVRLWHSQSGKRAHKIESLWWYREAVDRRENTG